MPYFSNESCNRLRNRLLLVTFSKLWKTYAALRYICSREKDHHQGFGATVRRQCFDHFACAQGAPRY